MHIGIIGGSGLEDRLNAVGLFHSHRIVNPSTPFGPTSGPIAVGEVPGTGLHAAVLKRHGDGHTIPPHMVPYRANIHALKSLGVTHIIATGAVGSLREGIRPGGVVLVDQFIDRTTGVGRRGENRTFFDCAAVHVEFADPCCHIMRDWLRSSAARVNSAARAPGDEIEVTPSGVYVCIDGPGFSTRAESHMHRALGADVVGMTALPEARLAREAEIAYALIALPTDYDCWMQRVPGAGTPVESLLAEIIGNLRRSADAGVRIIEEALRDPEIIRSHTSTAHDSLGLAIWTRKELIQEAEADRLRAIWGRHFPASIPFSG